jgi:hypothetical protein
MYLYDNKTMKSVEIVSSRGKEDEGEFWWGEPNQGTLQAYMEPFLYHSYVLIKMF